MKYYKRELPHAGGERRTLRLPRRRRGPRLRPRLPRGHAADGGSVEIEMISEVPPLICSGELTNEAVGYMRQMEIPGLTPT